MKQFKAIKVKALFNHGGNIWLKRSSRTAEIVKPSRFRGTWFYFGQDEYVKGVSE